MKPESPGSPPAPHAEENELLRRKVELLEREMEALQQHHGTARLATPHLAPPRPRPTLLRGLLIALVLIIAVGFAAGLWPKLQQRQVLATEASQALASRPIVPTAVVVPAPRETVVTLPGTMQPITEAPVLARADGYIKRRLVDIGDHVAAGQLLAEIEAPELDQQVKQAAAALDQTQSGLEQANANLAQGLANRELARVSAVRYGNLQQRGIVSRQENDTYQAQYQASAASVESLQKAVAAAQNNVSAAQANLARLKDMFSYLKVRAPFAGVVTLRNIDLGTLVTGGNTMLFRLAQTGVLRIFINVPQANASQVRVGQTTELSLNERPGMKFTGRITRSSDSLDPATRTMLVEVQVPNPRGDLLPGMYASVTLRAAREIPPLLIPSEALVARAQGTLAAVVDRAGIVHFTPIQVGRDSGTELEVLSGLEAGMQVIVNPNDKVREGVAVETRPFLRPRPAGAPPAQAAPETKKAN
jgi:RND family efflux transporter MFP subunit